MRERKVTITFSIDEKDENTDEWHWEQADAVVALLDFAPESWTYEGTEVSS